jgi:murein L,D-transpeptidase YafK
MTRMIKRDSFSVFWSAFLLVFCFIVFWASVVGASQVKKPIMKQDMVPSNLLKWGKSASEHLVLVDKSAQKVIVYRGDNLLSPEKVYNCSTGENDGPKSSVNDRKTPEGIYYFTDSYIDKYLAPIYGVRAFPISYPNFLDKKEGKDGYGIWFHGVDKPLKPKDTNGCIAMNNNDIDDFSAYVKLFETPIIISSNIEMVPFQKLEQDAEEIVDIVNSWRDAWQSKDIEKYITHYHKQFTSESRDREQWKQYKGDLAKRYRSISVKIDDLELLTNDGVVLARFTQDYQSDGLRSRGIKDLYFKKNDNQWKIIGEFFSGEDKANAAAAATVAATAAAPTAAVPKKPVVSDLKIIENLIYSWIDAWEKKDLNQYISFYDKGFSSRGMDLDEWEKHREKLNAKYNSFNISIKDLKIKKDSGNKASVNFKQIYKADDYRDYGLKKMVLVKAGKDWKIKEEEWTLIKK